MTERFGAQPPEPNRARRGQARARLLLLAAALALWPLAPAAAEDGGTLSLVVENDLFARTDRHYTNGVRLSWLSSPRETPGLVVRAARWLPFFPDGGSVRTSFALGQNMYTPNDVGLVNPPPDDRPYAGWLYGSAGVVVETGQRLDQLELALGVVGPASFADDTQKFVHSITGSEEPRGWDSQLGNEPGVVLTYQRSWRSLVSRTHSGFTFDVTPHAGGALGNVFTYANAGATFRFGQDLPLDYGVPRIQPSLPGSGFFSPSRSFGWYLFAGLEGRAVVRNIFLDGNSFRDSRSVDKQPFVGDLQLGVALTWRDVRLSYTHVLRTEEFEGQGGGSSFGALSLSLRF
ncbi:MAG: lipid A deacylase LpxR family protein [Tistlia sp.]|uniref:lipid A deacylase LpxR family protein n=1 Tax=Tistlia sp. TaxID=3057121 RepID=UPI0034A24C79